MKASSKHGHGSPPFNGNAMIPETEAQQPLCSVCIANYNGQEVLSACLDSVYSQQCTFQFEVILHDDASTDNSLGLVYEQYPRTVVIESKTNVGFCISNNRMVKKARGRYILLLNNDAALQPDALATLFNHAKMQATKGILTLPQYDWKTGELVDRGCLLDPFFNPIPNLDSKRRDVAMVIGACLWIPRSLWHTLGGFPEWMGSIAEDMYLCCVIRLCGFPIQVVGSSGYFHLQGMSFSGERISTKRLVSTYRRRKLSERNKTFIMLMLYPELFLPIAIPTHIAILLLEGALVSLATNNTKLFLTVYLKLPNHIFKSRKQILKYRKSIQRLRKISFIKFFSSFKLVPWKLILIIKQGFPLVK